MFSLTIYLFVAFLMLFLGGVVLVHDPRSRANRLLFAFTVSAVAWMTCNYLENAAGLSIAWRAVFLHADFAAASLGAGFILLFVINFVQPAVSARRLFLYFLPAAACFALSFSRLLVAEVGFASGGEIQFREGPLFPAYALLVIVSFVLPCVLLLLRRRTADPIARGQMSSVAAGLIATTAVTLTINLFLQNRVSADVFRVGIYAMLFFIYGVAWAIARHKFLRIRFVLIEILLLGILAAVLTRTILAEDASEVFLNLSLLAILLVLGFAMIRSFLKEERQRLDLQRLSDELAASNARLRKLDELKTTMVSIASHQFRGPLGGMRGYLTMFKDGDLGPLTDKQKEIVKMNLNVLSRLLNSVETFLDITKLEAGKITLRTEKLPLDAAVEDVVREFEAPFAKKGLTLAFAVQTERPVLVDFDPEKIKHVVFNLIDNAMKYTEKGGVTVTVGREGGKAVFEIADTGMGIPPDDLPRLFGKYERGELVVDRGGSGLGLYVVKMLTEMQGGQVSASSKGPGLGSVFRVTLPLARG